MGLGFTPMLLRSLPLLLIVRDLTTGEEDAEEPDGMLWP